MLFFIRLNTRSVFLPLRDTFVDTLSTPMPLPFQISDWFSLACDSADGFISPCLSETRSLRLVSVFRRAYTVNIQLWFLLIYGRPAEQTALSGQKPGSAGSCTSGAYPEHRCHDPRFLFGSPGQISYSFPKSPSVSVCGTE
jgi:hypothetical protein